VWNRLVGILVPFPLSQFRAAGARQQTLFDK
jgi:hypothetical protein